jgi:hypothetical protein
MRQCPACGYECNQNAKEPWDKPDGHGGSHLVHCAEFEELVLQVGLGRAKKFFICPSCGVVIAELV